jgi:hypothetical protein
MSAEDAQEPTFEDTTPVKTSPVLETERKLARSGEMPPPVSDPYEDEDYDEFADTVFEADQPTVDGISAAVAEATGTEQAESTQDAAEEEPIAAREALDEARPATSRRMLALVVAGVVLAMAALAALVYFGLLR